MNPRTAILLGASGSVGAALLRALLHDDIYTQVITLTRRALTDSHAKLTQELVPDMTAAALEAATVRALQSVKNADGFSALGVGGGTAKMTLEEHRAIDVGLNEAFARGLKTSGKVQHLSFMSAVGANPSAKTTGSGAAGMARYNRVKGEAEEAVRAVGPAVVSIFQPAMIIGSQHTPKLLEKILPAFEFLAPKKYHSITVDQIARAMVATGKYPPKTGATYHYPEMIALQ